MLTPGDTTQVTDVPEAHDALWQLDIPMRMYNVASSEPKLNPDSVALNAAVAAMFASATKLTTGAGREKSVALEIKNTAQAIRPALSLDQARSQHHRS